MTENNDQGTDSDGAKRSVPHARGCVARTCCGTVFGEPHTSGCHFAARPEDSIDYGQQSLVSGEVSGKETPTCECGQVTMEDYAEAVLTRNTYHVPKPNLFHRSRRCRDIRDSDLYKLTD